MFSSTECSSSASAPIPARNSFSKPKTTYYSSSNHSCKRSIGQEFWSLRVGSRRVSGTMARWTRIEGTASPASDYGSHAMFRNLLVSLRKA